MDIKITAGGVYGADGEYPIGTVIKGLQAAPKGIDERFMPIGDDGEPVLIVNPASDVPQAGAPYAARAKDDSPGWYQVFDAAGNAVGKAMRQADADAFNAMSDTDKAAFVQADS